MPGKQFRRDMRNARHFVEGEFGIGSASYKTSRNIETIDRAGRNWGRIEKKGPYGSPGLSLNYFKRPGFASPVGRSGGKQFIGFWKDKIEPGTMVHELTHAAYNRKRMRANQKRSRMVGEMLAYSKELDWYFSKQKHLYEYKFRQFRVDFYHTLYMMRTGQPTKDRSRMGPGIAYAIAQIFPKDAKARMKLRQALTEKYFLRYEQVLAWLEKNYGFKWREMELPHDLL